MVHDASEGKTFARWGRLGRKGVEETRDISADVCSPADAPEMVIDSPGNDPRLGRANRNRQVLGRSPPRLLQWREAGFMWFEASRKYAHPMNRNDEVPRPKPPWPPIYFIIDEIKHKTGRRRNEARGDYQAPSVDVLRTFQGVNGRTTLRQPISQSFSQSATESARQAHHPPTPTCRLWQALLMLPLAITHARALRRKRNADRVGVALPSDARSTNLRRGTRGRYRAFNNCMLGSGCGCGCAGPGGHCSGSCPGRGQGQTRLDTLIKLPGYLGTWVNARPSEGHEFAVIARAASVSTSSCLPSQRWRS